MKYYLAIDLGASSGRHIVGHEENGELILEEVHRFSNGMIESPNGLVWDLETLFKEIKIGIKKSIEKYHNIESLSIDTWGVDYVLLNGDEIKKPFYAYRNARCELASKKVHDIIPFNVLYEHTGMQFAAFNTIYQLFDDLKNGRLDDVTDFLMIPEYFEYLLTGNKVKEYTDASTTGLLDLKTNSWDFKIVDKLGLPRKIFKPLVAPGTEVGMLKDEITKEVGGQIKVVTCPSHDTASAFEAVNCPDDAIILSSGTWSLIGVKIPTGNNSKESFATNFTNEGGVNYIRYLKNIMGMWIPNQVLKQVSYSFDEIASMVRNSSYNETFDVNDSLLTAPNNMKEAVIKLLCNDPPKNDADLFRSIYRSLAVSYDKASKELEKNLNKKFNYIYIVGGGAKCQPLNEFAEEITGKKVVALPIEATAIGNIKSQIK